MNIETIENKWGDYDLKKEKLQQYEYIFQKCKYNA